MGWAWKTQSCFSFPGRKGAAPRRELGFGVSRGAAEPGQSHPHTLAGVRRAPRDLDRLCPGRFQPVPSCPAHPCQTHPFAAVLPESEAREGLPSLSPFPGSHLRSPSGFSFPAFFFSCSLSLLPLVFPGSCWLSRSGSEFWVYSPCISHELGMPSACLAPLERSQGNLHLPSLCHPCAGT